MKKYKTRMVGCILLPLFPLVWYSVWKDDVAPLGFKTSFQTTWEDWRELFWDV